MKPTSIPYANRTLRSQVEGIEDLQARLITGVFGPQLQSDWSPSAEELKCLNAGGVIRLHIIGEAHPAVMLTAVNTISEMN